jgi:hypothetical protein
MILGDLKQVFSTLRQTRIQEIMTAGLPQAQHICSYDAKCFQYRNYLKSTGIDGPQR